MVKATEFYAEACLESRISLLNCIPVFIASNPLWSRRFLEKGIPIVGDDVKSQLGATITHRVLAKLFEALSDALLLYGKSPLDKSAARFL